MYSASYSLNLGFHFVNRLMCSPLPALLGQGITFPPRNPTAARECAGRGSNPRWHVRVRVERLRRKWARRRFSRTPVKRVKKRRPSIEKRVPGCQLMGPGRDAGALAFQLRPGFRFGARLFFSRVGSLFGSAFLFWGCGREDSAPSATGMKSTWRLWTSTRETRTRSVVPTP
jgi:hypothetical protein